MYRVRTVFTGPQGSPWLSTAFFEESGGTAQAAANAVGTFWGAVDALMVNSVSWATESDVALIFATNGELTGVSSTTPNTGAGALSSEALPWVAQGLMRWRTAQVVNGRSVKGRTFIPGLVVAASDDGRLVSTQQTTINNAATALCADANSEFGVWHRPAPAGGGGGLFCTATTGSVWSQFASLRSRRD